MSKKVEEIKQNIIRNMQIREDAKTTTTPFGKVSTDLKTITHKFPLKKGEILATVLHKKTGSRKEEFVWNGIVKESIGVGGNYDWMTGKISYEKYIIYYRPFVDQYEKNVERREQLYRKQMRDLK